MSAYLLAAVKDIKTFTSGRLRVLKIARVPDQDVNDLWKLSTLLTLGGKGQNGEPVLYESHGEMLCRFSDDDEIVSGRIIRSWTLDSDSLRTSGQILMEEVTKQVRLDLLPITDNWDVGLEQTRQYRFQTAVEDYNGDGHLDIAVASADDRAILLEWNPKTGRFQDVTGPRGLPTGEFLTENHSYLASWIDYDNDGDPDLILGETLYQNVEGKRFEPAKYNGGFRFAYHPMGAIVADYDLDGLLDLYVLYQTSPNKKNDKPPSWINDDESGAVNQLWQNRGDGRFVEVARTANATAGTRHTFAATWLYANDDHYPDLYVANDFASNSLLINQGDGTFDDVADESIVGSFSTSMGVASGDINGDGTPEIYVANMFSKMGRRIIAMVSEEDYPPSVYEQLKGSCAGNQLYSTTGDIREYTEQSEQLGINAVGWAYAPAFLDYDGDGQLDLYATTGFLSFDRTKPDG
jgi:hypothetical protein